MKTPVLLDSKLVTPCGVYCGACYDYLCDKNKCLVCRIDFETKPKSWVQCHKANHKIISPLLIRLEKSDNFHSTTNLLVTNYFSINRLMKQSPIF